MISVGNDSMFEAGRDVGRFGKVGFLTFDLQSFVQELLQRLKTVMQKRVEIKAYPIFFHPAQNDPIIEMVPTMLKAKPFLRNCSNHTPEGMAWNGNIRSAWRIAFENDVVVLYGLLGVSALAAGFFARLLGKTVVSVNHSLSSDVEKKREWWIRFLKSILLKLCDLHVCQTAIALDVLENVYKCRQSSLFLAPFSAGYVELLKAFPPNECRDGISGREDTVVFAFVGNMVPFKGTEDVLRACVVLPKQLRFKLIMAGAFAENLGFSGKYYRDTANRLGITDRVDFVGALSGVKLIELYKVADVVILPTHKDCTPKVLVEAAMAGKPIITTDVHGWIGTVVQDGENAIVIKPGDIEALAAAMVKMSDPELRTKMGKTSRRLVEQHCDPAKETEGFVQAINAAIELQQRKNRRSWLVRMFR